MVDLGAAFLAYFHGPANSAKLSTFPSTKVGLFLFNFNYVFSHSMCWAPGGIEMVIFK